VSSRAAMVAQLTQNGFVDLVVGDEPSAG